MERGVEAKITPSSPTYLEQDFKVQHLYSEETTGAISTGLSF